MSSCARPLPTALSRAALTLAVVLLAVPAHAQFKVIGPDGKVTYTDREPNASEGKVVPIGSRAIAAAPAAAEPELPFEVRQAVTRYPVTLYVTTDACDPCNAGRQMLKQRGIPFTEKLVVSAQDGEALEKVSGGREAPTLTIGAQVLRGYAIETWGANLDAAGYPRESQLPSNYQYKPAAPVVERRVATTVRAEPRVDARPASPSPSPTPPPTPGGIRF
jgi:glutaredoxin